MKILITGATGLIGKELGKKLVQQGHQIFIISRDAKKAKTQVPFPCHVIEGDISKEIIRSSHLTNIEAVVHLAGENISGERWTAEVKEKILNSRVQGAKNLIQSFKTAPNLKVMISASAVGYYGDRNDEILTENSAPGTGFLAEVCQQWEAPLTKDWEQSSLSHARWGVFRFGVVLSAFGGALEKMIMPFRFGVGGKLGNGKQWVSWIHIDDLVRLLTTAIEDERYHGVYNAVSPNPETNEVLTDLLAEALNKRAGPPVPSVALKVVLGEMAAMVLSSQRAVCDKVQKMGFEFLYPDLRSALEQACHYHQDGDLVLFSEQYLPKARTEVFPFFTDAQNLEKITPPTLNFEIVGMSGKEVEEGTVIDYRLKIRGIPVKWQSKIEEWKPGEKFQDAQIKGPYAKWVHLHEFSDLGDGTLMRDVVRYKLPMGPLGELTAGWFVKKDVEEIFSFRRQYVAKSIT